MKLLRVITCGSVDDGKSSLLGRLLLDLGAIPDDQLPENSKNLLPEYVLASVTDGLKEEREKGITVDVAYRYFSSDNVRFVLADCPGHFEFTKNMVTGCSTAEGAIVLLDAKKGLQDQTLRHAAVVSLMKVPQVVVCVNKMDLVDYSQERFLELSAEVKRLFLKLGVSEIKVIPVGAIEGDNVVNQSEKMEWYNGGTLMQALENFADYSPAERQVARSLMYRLPQLGPDQANYEKKYLGVSQLSGVLEKGDELRDPVSGQSIVVKEIFSGVTQLEKISAPRSATIEYISSSEKGAFSEDHAKVIMETAGSHRPLNVISSKQNVELFWISDKKLDQDAPIVLKSISQEVEVHCKSVSSRLDWASLDRIEAGFNSVNENELLGVELDFGLNKLASDAFIRDTQSGSFVLIDPSDNEVLAAGFIG